MNDDKINIIIVLGIRKKSVMKKRVDRALDEYKKLKKNSNKIYLLLSGGSSDGVSKPEGSIMMYNYVKENFNGVNLVVEKKSRNTIENLMNCKKIISDNYNKKDVNIIVCTSSFHVKRTIIIAKLIFNEEYNIKFIHTNEHVCKKEIDKEMQILLQTLNRYTETFL